MAEAQEQYDFHMVLDALWEDLVDELELEPVLKDLEVKRVFRRSEIRDLREEHPTTTKKVNALLQLVRDGDHTKYDQFKRCLVDSGQEDLVKTMKAVEKGEYKPAVKKNPRTGEEKLLQDRILPVEISRMDKGSIELYKKALAEGKEAVHNIRVMVVGHYGVGKTTLTKRLLCENIDIGKRESTDGIDVHVDKCKIDLDTKEWTVVNEDQTRETAYHRLANVMRQIHSDGQEPKVEKQERDGQLPQMERQESEMKPSIQNINLQEVVIPYETIYTRDNTDIEMEKLSQDMVDKTAGKNMDTDRSEAALLTDLQNLIHETGERSTDNTKKSTADLSVWDFAGQYAFYATHQVFLSKRAVYLLVTDISKHIDDVVRGDFCYLDSNGAVECKISEYVNFWLNTIHEFCSSDDTKGPPVILVGTFVDQLNHETKEEVINNFEFKLRCSLVDRVISRHLVDKIFGVDNTETHSALDSLRAKILQTAQEQEYWGETIPAKWLTLENVLLKLKANGLKVVEKSHVMRLNSELPVPLGSPEELELFLNFHHEFGNVIYFGKDEDLNKTVLLDPKWLIDAFKCLITAKMFCSKKEDILKQWIEFDNSAILRNELIDVIWESENSFKDHIPLILQYLEKLGLLAKPRLSVVDKRDQVVDYYFAPSVLKKKPPPEIHNNDSGNGVSTNTLFFTTESQFVPTACFNKLLAACIQRYPLAKIKDKGMVFCGCGVFTLQTNHRLHLRFFDSVIQVWITRYSISREQPEESLCQEIKVFIQDFLKKELYSIFSYVQCPHGKKYKLDELILQKVVLCDCHSLPDVWETTHLTKFWCLSEEDSNTESHSLTDKELNLISKHVGKEYRVLGFQLGLSRQELDQIDMDGHCTVDRITKMLIKWRDTKSKQGTFQELKSAMILAECDVSGAFKSIQGCHSTAEKR